MYLAFRHLVIYKWSTGYIMTCAKEGGKLWFSPSCSPHIQSHSFLSRLSLTHTHTHTHTTPHTTPPPMSLTCMLHSLDRHTVGNQNIITLSHTAANSGVATIQNSRAALTLNFHMKVGATKYRPAGREFETPALVNARRKKGVSEFFQVCMWDKRFNHGYVSEIIKTQLHHPFKMGFVA